MRYAVDPRQIDLFDLAECMFSPKTITAIQNDWPAVFRKQVLHLMPVVFFLCDPTPRFRRGL